MRRDVKCYEAFDKLVGSHMLSGAQESELLRSLTFKEEDLWLKVLYRARCNSYDLSVLDPLSLHHADKMHHQDAPTAPNHTPASRDVKQRAAQRAQTIFANRSHHPLPCATFRRTSALWMARPYSAWQCVGGGGGGGVCLHSVHPKTFVPAVCVCVPAVLCPLSLSAIVSKCVCVCVCVACRVCMATSYCRHPSHALSLALCMCVCIQCGCEDDSGGSGLLSWRLCCVSRTNYRHP